FKRFVTAENGCYISLVEFNRNQTVNIIIGYKLHIADACGIYLFLTYLLICILESLFYKF
ncbi:MAG: hypothetical protein IJO08_02560, partial [Clostridia bacterium]|nr:hypothetical protein [Clostridia bacterium]